MDDVTEKIIGAAIAVHRVPGPGLLESIYEEALCHEFELRGIEYKGKLISGQRMDLIVDNSVVIELKSSKSLPEVASAQTLSYLRATGLKRTLLINFGNTRLIDGIKRFSLCTPQGGIKKLCALCG